MARNPQADLVAQLVDEDPDLRVQVVGDQVVVVGPGDVGKILVVQPDGTIGFTTDSGPVLTVMGRTGNVVGLVEDTRVSNDPYNQIDWDGSLLIPTQNVLRDLNENTIAFLTTILAALAGAIFTGEVAAPDFKATGKTGATDFAAILAGGKTAGPPTTGAHVAGEMVPDGNGALWICTSAGTPGTWRRAGAPGFVVVPSQGTNLTLAANALTLADVEATGTAAARPRDLVIPGVVAGDWVDLRLAFLVTTQAGGSGIFFDYATYVAGVRQHTTSVGFGITGSLVPASSTAVSRNLSWQYQVQASDIENGSVRFRLQYGANQTSGNDTVFDSGGFVLLIAGR